MKKCEVIFERAFGQNNE